MTHSKVASCPNDTVTTLEVFTNDGESNDDDDGGGGDFLSLCRVFTDRVKNERKT